ncbi:MAG: ion transporter [Spirochaetales bacterium]|jgi:hypothetical protein|nr:ion transporter [Spirochaetales bacterium]
MKRNVRYLFGAALVFLALAEVLCEDLAALSGLSVSVRRLLVCAGFLFDLFFTAQFLVGLYTASLNRKTRRYFAGEGGWIDFLAAVPLLVLYSGPAMFGIAAGGVCLLPGVLRMSAGLRFLRFLKLFRLRRAPARGKSAAAFLVSVLIAAGSLLGPALSGAGGAEKHVIDTYFSAAFRLSSGSEDIGREIREYSRTEPDLLLVKQKAAALYSRYDAVYYNTYYGGADYLYLRSGTLDFYFSLKTLAAGEARRGISHFCVLAALFSAFFIYVRVSKKS